MRSVERKEGRSTRRRRRCGVAFASSSSCMRIASSLTSQTTLVYNSQGQALLKTGERKHAYKVAGEPQGNADHVGLILGTPPLRLHSHFLSSDIKGREEGIDPISRSCIPSFECQRIESKVGREEVSESRQSEGWTDRCISPSKCSLTAISVT